MDKMRKGTGVILWVLIFSFGILWMLQDTDFFSVLQGGPRSLGSVNGEKISLDEYNNRMQYFTQQHSRQTGNSMNPETRAQFQERAWNVLVSSKLIQQKMDDLGIAVTDQEVVDMISGENPAPFIRQQFQREDGTIDRGALQAAIDAPENTQMWIQVEQQLRQQRRQRKMNNYLQSSMQISDYEVEQEYIRQNTTADVSYVRFPYSDVDESEISVTEDDLRSYYQNHQQKYKRKEQYRFEYVSFDKTPTKKDTMRTFNDIKDLRSDFASAEDDSLFLARYQSSTDYSSEMIPKSDVRERYRPVLDVAKNEVTEVIREQGRMYVLKKKEENADEVAFVVFSLDVKADPVATIDKRAQKADDFSYYAEQDGFSAEAERRSLKVQEGFATKGNNFVSGIGQSRQILNFLTSASEGGVSSSIELSNQFVVLNVTEITPAGTQPFEEVKKQIRTVVKNNKLKQYAVNNANTLAEQNDDLQAVAKASGNEVNTVSSLAMDDETVGESGREPQVVGAIFGLKEGSHSSALEGTSAAFIVQVNKLREAEVENLTPQIREQIRRKLKQSKSQIFMETWIEELKDEADIEDNREQLLRG